MTRCISICHTICAASVLRAKGHKIGVNADNLITSLASMLSAKRLSNHSFARTASACEDAAQSCPHSCEAGEGRYVSIRTAEGCCKLAGFQPSCPSHISPRSCAESCGHLSQQDRSSMKSCGPRHGPPSPPLSPLSRPRLIGRASQAECFASPSRTRVSRLQRLASEQGAPVNPAADLREVEQALETLHREGTESSGRQRGPVIDTPSLDPTRTELERQKEVERALKLVDAAMKAAEGQLDDIPNLPSARLKRKVGSFGIRCTFRQRHLSVRCSVSAW